MYDKNGNETNKDNRAVAIERDGRYQILISNDGEIFDPLDRLQDINKMDVIRGKKMFNLQNCKFNCFYVYLRYLCGGNRCNLQLAQRRFLDA